jgi:hypothetical protein
MIAPEPSGTHALNTLNLMAGILPEDRKSEKNSSKTIICGVLMHFA